MNTLVSGAQSAVSSMSRRMPLNAAIQWVHTAAVLSHADHYGLPIGPVDLSTVAGIRAAADRLAALHPALSGFADRSGPLWEHAPTVADTDALNALYGQGPTPVADEQYRPDGYLIGDLYQALSEEARKGRALCQTPRFVSSLLLDISFDHAYRESGPHVRMIDPACGTGHILMEAFIRTVSLQQSGFGRDCKPALPRFTSAVERVRAALDAVHGVDLDPYAVLIARYRLLLMAFVVAAARRHRLTPEELAGLPLHIAAADSLLDDEEPLLQSGRYDVVVMNPPYITPKDKASRDAIRTKYREVCHGKYALSLPFHLLAARLLRPGGWCAQLTANSFMKREFGQAYIEKWLSRRDLTWVIDTSGAYIPGHGTPTLILADRNQAPTSTHVPTVRGNRGEPSVPADPAKGKVWSAIAAAVSEREAYRKLAAGLAAASGQRPEPVPAPGEGPRNDVAEQLSLWAA